MRNYVPIIGLLLLLGLFAGTWLLLQPSEPQPTGAGNIDDSVATLDNSGHVPSSVYSEEGNTTDRSDPLSPTRSEDPQVDPTGEVTGPDKPPGEITETKPPVKTVAPDRNTTNPERDPAGEKDPSPDSSEQAQKFVKGYKRPPGQNLGNTRPTSRRIGTPAGVKKLDDVSTKLRQDRRGLLASYARLQKNENGQWLPDTHHAYTRIDREISFPDAESFSDLPMPLDNFGATWTGFLVIETAGDYWFFLGADNGGRVELDGETVLLQDGMVRYVEVSAVLTLEPGLHPIKIEFAQQMNGVADAAKCAAAFMYVPEGQSKPIAVPPEMLMVPEWMWSDNAPIITSLSKTEGEIGDEITINGGNFGPGETNEIPMKQWLSLVRVGSWLRPDEQMSEAKTPDRLVSVTIGGQFAQITEQSNSSLRVQVPIGAKSGTVIVYAQRFSGYYFRTGIGVVTYATPIPSNSSAFKVTTQFGLKNEWYDLESWTNFDVDVFDTGVLPDPSYTAIEPEPGDEAVPEGLQAHAVAWYGKIGIPLGLRRKLVDGELGHRFVGLQIVSNSHLRFTAGSKTARAWGTEPPRAGTAPFHFHCEIPVEVDDEGYVSVRIEGTSESDAPTRWFLNLIVQDAFGEETFSGSYSSLFFPPEPPPEPPQIVEVHRGSKNNSPLAESLYDSEERLRVQEGDWLDVTLRFSLTGDEYGEIDYEFYIDGMRAEHLPAVSKGVMELNWYTNVHAVRVPAGVGEGKLYAVDRTMKSEPYLLDVVNKGLVAYLYDVPDAGGLRELPDLAPLTCFKVRKDRQINFESVADFDLPFPAETFVIEWLGGLIIEEEGDYEFICRSDDGMKLWLDDNVVIDADHPQAPAENTATVHLVPGVYRFRMQFFENNQHEVCVLEWRATRGEDEALEELIPRQVIPARAFSLDVHPAFPAKTSTGKRTDGS